MESPFTAPPTSTFEDAIEVNDFRPELYSQHQWLKLSLGQEPLMTKTNVLSKPRGGIKSWLSLQIRRTFSSRLLTGTLDTAQVAGVTWSTTYNLKSPRKQTMMLIWIPGYTTICQFMKELVHHFRDVLFVKLQCKEPSGS